MGHAPDHRHGWRVRAVIVVLWRAGLRIQEALALTEHDLDPRRGSLLVRSGKGGRRREVGIDAWGWEQLQPWLNTRAELPVGPLFCIIDGPTRGRPWSGAAVRAEFRHLATSAGVRRRFAPHQLRHAHALELARKGVALNIIQRQLGHANLGTTSIYLQGIDPEEIIRRLDMLGPSLRLRQARQGRGGAAAGAVIRRAGVPRSGCRPDGTRGPPRSTGNRRRRLVARRAPARRRRRRTRCSATSGSLWP
jgi:integrase